MVFETVHVFPAFQFLYVVATAFTSSRSSPFEIPTGTGAEMAGPIRSERALNGWKRAFLLI